MEGPDRFLLLAGRLYAEHALNHPFEVVQTDRPGRPYSVISYGEVQDRGMSRAVVFKTYRKIGDTSAKKAALRTYREVEAWVSLLNSPGRCDNINLFHGVLFLDPRTIWEVVPGTPSIVTDFVKYDSLEYALRRDFRGRLDIVQQLANGISYMHSLNLIHGDIKPDNFRITEEGVVKIIDLGLSRYHTTEPTGLTTMILPCYRFVAPELIKPDSDAVSMSVTKATDSYAFSMTALQVLDGQGYKSLPFNHCKVPFAVRLAVTTNQWPRSHNYPGVLPRAWTIVASCWTSDPSTRPSIDELITSLSTV